MPNCKCINVEAVEYQLNEETRLRFACEYAEVNSNPALLLTGASRSHFITLFGTDRDKEDAFKEKYVDTNRMPNMDIMSIDVPVKPFLRVYTINTKHAVAGDLILDQVTGAPKVYTTLSVSVPSKMVKGEEVPLSMAEAERLANNKRDYFSKNADARTGIVRYRDVDSFSADAENFAYEDQVFNDAPAAEAVVPQQEQEQQQPPQQQQQPQQQPQQQQRRQPLPR